MGGFSLCFKDVDDPRTGNAKRHDFREMVMIALLSSMCGGRTCVDMADFAANNEAFLRRFMALERGTPSRDTFSRLFRLLDPEPFAAAMAQFAEDWGRALEEDGGRQIAVDGKTLRRSHMRAGETSPLHMAGALLTEAGIVPGQTAVDGKSNGIPAMAALLELLDIKGAAVTADAMHAQRNTAEPVTGKGGDCALALKASQGSLRKDAKEWLEDPEAAKEMLSCRHVGGSHGRTGTRAATVSHDIGWLQDLHRCRASRQAAVRRVPRFRLRFLKTRAGTMAVDDAEPDNMNVVHPRRCTRPQGDADWISDRRVAEFAKLPGHNFFPRILKPLENTAESFHLPPPETALRRCFDGRALLCDGKEKRKIQKATTFV